MSPLGLLPLVFAVFAGYPLLSSAAPSPQADPCAKIAESTFVLPADALACYKSFPFNETLRQNVLTNAARVLDFFTFEDYYLNSPPPFEESTVNIRAALAKFNTTQYDTDYDFNKALYDFSNQLNDGHTRYFPTCYTTFQSIMPAPVVSLEKNGVQNIYIAPDSVEFLSQLGSNYTSHFDSINFDWKRLAGAKVLEIEGQDAYAYVDFVAKTVSGNYLDHGVRVNSVFSSYRIAGGSFSQRIGDLAGPVDVTRTSLKFKLVAVNLTKAETIDIPYLASYGGSPFTDSESYWQNNCAAVAATNGVDLRAKSHFVKPRRKQPKAVILDGLLSKAVGLPGPFQPSAPPVNGSDHDALKSFILPGSQTGVMFVGTFEPADFDQFQADVAATVNAFKAASVTQLIVDLSNNGGGYVCLGLFLHQYLAGSGIGYGGFESTMRANPLARKILAAHVGQNTIETFYSSDNWAFLNDTVMPNSFNYLEPAISSSINGKSDFTSQRFHDVCESSFSQPIPASPPFDLSKVAIVTNGNCASTCALFSTLMNEREKTKIAVFGGKPGEDVQFKGMAGNQVLDWPDLDSEIKSVGLKDDELAPPDLLVNSNFRVNWRTAWSFIDENTPIAYQSELPLFRFPYTEDTYNNPQNLWTFAASKLFA